MKIYVNDKNEIHDVGYSADESLHEVNVTDGTFDGWSKAKICCYVADVRDGHVVTLYPYVSTLIIEQLDRIGKVTDDNSEGLFDTAEATSDISDALFELADYVAELEARIIELEGREE